MSGDTVKRASTGLVYDEYMLLHANQWDNDHIERPQRLISILDTIREQGLESRCEKLESMEATDEELRICVPKQLIESLEEMTGETCSMEEREEFSANFEDIYVNKHSLKAARLACGSAINAVKSVVNGEVCNSMALVRPPGHHAYWDTPCGFCLFNNVAICAKYALDVLKLDRVMIVDWDIHAGQGTQYALQDDHRCLFFSIHRYEYGKFWPNLPETNWDYIGEGSGKGFNVNVPLNYIGMGDDEYTFIFDTLLMPLAVEFNPQLVLVSAGFDSAFGDPEGEMRVTPVCYAHLTKRLMNLAEGKVCVILEGGYFIDSLKHSAAYTLRTLLGDSPPKLKPSLNPHLDVQTTVLCLMKILSKYWKWCASYIQLNLHSRQVLALDHFKIAHVALYKGNRVCPIPYPTRGLYPPRPADLEESLRMELIDIMGGYTERVTDNRLVLFHNEKLSNQHFSLDGESVECPQRLNCALEGITGMDVPVVQVDQLASEDIIAYVHTKEHIQRVKELEDGWILDDKAEKYPTYANSGTYNAACSAVQCTLDAVDSVMQDNTTTALALVRPPGHQAKPRSIDGFCFFNNVAIAARYVQNKYGIKKVLILDLDVHFGDGTCEVFTSDPSVLYVSLHLFNDARYYPRLSQGSSDNIGKGGGKGYNINVAWNNSKTDQDYLFTFHSIILPILRQFNPDFILVSAGLDAIDKDALGGFHLSCNVIPYIIKYINTFAQSRVVSVLEGGYNLENMAQGVKNIVEPTIELPEFNTTIEDDTVSTLAKLVSLLKNMYHSIIIGEL